MENKILHRLYCAIYDLSSPCFIKDPAGIYIYINKAAANLAGLEPQQFLGRDDVDVFGPESGSVYRAKDRAVLCGEKISPLDVFTDSDGNTSIYFVVREIIHDQDNNVCGIIGVRTNITDHLNDIGKLSGAV